MFENRRKNMRLRGYDYSRAGLYFLTPVIQHRLHLFGEIHTGGPTCSPKMVLNDGGRMVEKWYWEIENKYPDKRCREMVVMPNHFHCIIENLELAETNATKMDAHVGASLRGRSINNDGRFINDEKYGIHNKKYGATIGGVMDWFKTMTTNEYIRGVKNHAWPRFDGKLWQRNYYDHIVRNETDYIRIAEYIINNPIKWGEDKFKNE